MALKSLCRFLALVSVLVFAHFHGLCHAEEAPNYSFIQEATSAPQVSFHDYIIIDGGAAGCPLAATLSTRNANVLVLERGGSPYANTTKIRRENFITTLTDMSPDSFSQAFISEDQGPGPAEDGVPGNRASVLGGGTAINVGIYSRAETSFLKQIGLDEALAKESYEWVENKLVTRPGSFEWQSAVRNGLLEAGVLPDNGFTYAHINGTKTSGTIFDAKGNRRTAADLLGYANPRRIKVYLHAVVHRITFKTQGVDEMRPKAEGVIYYDANGGKHVAYLKNESNNDSEIMLSAGAIGSPQLLMLSDIGPAAQLRSLGIKVVLDQPMVGREMGDNPINSLIVPYPNHTQLSLSTILGIANSGKNYILTFNGFDLSPLSVSKAFREAASNSTANVGVVSETIRGPISKGYLELRNTNVSDNPRVRFNYFQAAEDLRNCVQGMQTIIDVVNSRSLSRFHFKNTTIRDLLEMMVNMQVNLRPKNRNATTSLEHYCIDTVMTVWHYHGGCRIGKVVDKDFKVFGVDGLRVVDASTFSFSPGTNPQATIMMLGRSMGRRILQRRRR
ncbi:hypothetical protein like AT3G56060 [Hibiscus trionum]|uniref:Glucose-methanol-choline oxidoreductase N-terminal domain-containing protein n=1 Tax=Hibiscus trionum TaxID=183268 RepID=A0A9W7HW62_HIBTR|nr:hypothetical protein like AT3G56060 [Hibiscus trionum]